MRINPQNANSIKNTATRIVMLRIAVKKLVENALWINPQNVGILENTATSILTLPNDVQKLVENASSRHINNII